jgi:hypothetical protein
VLANTAWTCFQRGFRCDWKLPHVGPLQPRGRLGPGVALYGLHSGPKGPGAFLRVRTSKSARLRNTLVFFCHCSGLSEGSARLTSQDVEALP